MAGAANPTVRPGLWQAQKAGTAFPPFTAPAYTLRHMAAEGMPPRCFRPSQAEQLSAGEKDPRTKEPPLPAGGRSSALLFRRMAVGRLGLGGNPLKRAAAEAAKIHFGTSLPLETRFLLLGRALPANAVAAKPHLIL